MNSKISVWTLILLINTGTALSEEKTLTWNFGIDDSTSFDLSIKGTWKDSGITFWREPETVTVRAKLHITANSDDGFRACSITVEFFDADKFKLYEYKLREERDSIFTNIYVASEQTLNGTWNMDYETFIQIHRASVTPNLPRKPLQIDGPRPSSWNRLPCDYDRR